MSEIRDRVNQVFRQVFNDDALDLSDQMTPSDLEKWDSLAHVNLMFALEQAFQIRFTTEDLSAMQSVGELTRSIETKLAKR
jgi:acyl carrier protein